MHTTQCTASLDYQQHSTTYFRRLHGVRRLQGRGCRLQVCTFTLHEYKA
jgi:hypothetical protein